MVNREIFLGNLYNQKKGTGYAGTIYDSDGVAPCLTTCQGGGREPHILVIEEDKENIAKDAK